MVNLLFPEYKDDSFSRSLTFVISFGIVALISLLYLSNQLNFGITAFFLAFSLITMGLSLIESDSKDQIIDARYFQNKFSTYIWLIGGIVIGLIIVLIASRNPQLSQTLVLAQNLTLPNLQFLNQNILAPLSEELFWRGFFVPTCIIFATAFVVSIFGNNKFALATGFVLGALIGNFLGFGYYHLFVYYTLEGNAVDTFEAIASAGSMGLLFTISYYFVRSIALPIGWHFINNLYASGYSLIEIIPTTIFFLILFFIVVEIVDRIKPKK